MNKKPTDLTILMYHGIVHSPEDIPQNREVGAELYDVSLKNFKDQMALLKEKGFNGTSLDGLSDHAIILTFDDGEMNNCTQALPVLIEHGFRAYFFIIAKRVGKPGYMGWGEIKKLHDAGMIIGSHGLSHEILTNLKETQIEEELSASKKNLERNLEIEIDTLSIPRGFCNDKIIEMVYKAGYKHVFISDRPKNLTQSCISRIAVKGAWSTKRFSMALNGQVPIKELIGDKIKGAAKLILRETGYNYFRKMVIKTVK